VSEAAAETEAKPAHAYHLDRASKRTAAEREEHFQVWLAKHEPYDAAIVAAGDELWHGGDVEKRRELFMRRYRDRGGLANG
jgi:hypothetical protein